MNFGKTYTEKVLQAAQESHEGFGVDETAVRVALNGLYLENEKITPGVRKIKTKRGWIEKVITPQDADRLSDAARRRNERKTQAAINDVEKWHHANAVNGRNMNRVIGANYDAFGKPIPTTGDIAYKMMRRSMAQSGQAAALEQKATPYLIGIMVFGTSLMCLIFDALAKR